MLLLARGGAAFQPRFTLTILYFSAFLLLFCIAIAAPALVEVLRSTPPGPEQEAIAHEAARRAVGPRLPIAAAAAFVATGIGIYARLLPGFRAAR